MKKYTCTALIKYSKQEVELHINALKIALQGENVQDYRGPYLALLQDMQRIKNQMLDKENDAMADRSSGTDLVIEGSVTENV
tara:strand:+ start:1516 stop:1761 length:246 start_codon:yes stop_codon:yes gene_type:complete